MCTTFKAGTDFRMKYSRFTRSDMRGSTDSFWFVHLHLKLSKRDVPGHLCFLKFVSFLINSLEYVAYQSDLQRFTVWWPLLYNMDLDSWTLSSGVNLQVLEGSLYQSSTESSDGLEALVQPAAVLVWPCNCLPHCLSHSRCTLSPTSDLRGWRKCRSLLSSWYCLSFRLQQKMVYLYNYISVMLFPLAYDRYKQLKVSRVTV